MLNTDAMASSELSRVVACEADAACECAHCKNSQTLQSARDRFLRLISLLSIINGAASRWRNSGCVEGGGGPEGPGLR